MTGGTAHGPKAQYDARIYDDTSGAIGFVFETGGACYKIELLRSGTEVLLESR
jgi:hypothetical protein